MQDQFVRPLMTWYGREHRALPWRQDPTPYRVWISEIMLQQTRIEAVIPYFERFMAALPDIPSLAAVPDDVLMKLWEGLGYYSRARNLKKAAGVIVDRFAGELPRDYEQLLSLPGIGAYTAGAIASIAYGIPVPAVDGNVMRVMARVDNCADDVMKPAVKKACFARLAAVMPTDAAGAFNQALMELGERICLPNAAPRCEICPIADFCAARAAGTQYELPVRIVKKTRRIEQKTVLVIRTVRNGKPQVLLHKRPETGLLAGLWELPHLDGDFTDAPLPAAFDGCAVSATLPRGKHIFTHIEWRLSGLLLDAPYGEPPVGYVWADTAALHAQYALPTAFQTYSRLLPILLEGE